MSTARITFTRPAADRIANVVRIVEQGSRDEAPLTFTRVPDPGGGKTFRIAAFTGAWSINASKVVTLRGVTATLSAQNLFLNISVDCGSRTCAIAKDGSEWYLIAAECG